MKNTKQNNLIMAIATIVIGVLFVWLRSGVINIAMTVAGIALIVYGVLDITKKNTTYGAVKLVVGIVIIVFGWLVREVALYIMAALLLVYGVLGVMAFFRAKGKKSAFATVVALSQPVICVLVALCLFFNPGETLSWLFVVSGILLIVQGALETVNCLQK